MIDASAIIGAFGLPPAALVDRRIPKTALIDHGASRKADARLVETGLARLDWLAELSPPTVAIPASERPPVPAVNLLLLQPIGSPKARLVEIIHRAIPAPIMLITAGQAPQITLATRDIGEDGHSLVMGQIIACPPIHDDEAGRAFIASLALGGLPRLDLALLYAGLIERSEAFAAAQVADAPFRLPANRAEAEMRRQLLSEWRSADAAWQAGARAAKAEKRLREAVELGEKARVLKQKRDAVSRLLA